MKEAEINLNRDLAAIQRLADEHGVRLLYFGGPSPETGTEAGGEIHVEVETPDGHSRLAAAEFLLALEGQLNRSVRLIHCAGLVREPVESLCLQGILEGAGRVKALPVPNVLALLPDRGLRERVIRDLRLIGELAHRLPRTFQEGHPDVAWESVERYRNFLFVDNINMQEIWEILHAELPQLAVQVGSLIDQPGNPRPS